MTAAAIPCPSCLAAPGEWCRRHGQTQPGPLLYCPERVEVTPESAPFPTCDNCQTATPNLWFRYWTTGDGLEHIETLCETCYNATGDEVTE